MLFYFFLSFDFSFCLFISLNTPRIKAELLKAVRFYYYLISFVSSLDLFFIILANVSLDLFFLWWGCGEVGVEGVIVSCFPDRCDVFWD